MNKISISGKFSARLAAPTTALAVAIVSGTALADIQVTSTHRIEGGGDLKALTSSADYRLSVSGSAGRVDLVDAKTLPRGDDAPESTLLFLDGKAAFEIFPSYNEITETPLSRYAKNLLDRPIPGIGQALPDNPLPVTEKMCKDMGDLKVITDRDRNTMLLGESARYLGVEQSLLCKNRPIKSTCKATLVTEVWLAPELNGADEYAAFFEGYAKASRMPVAIVAQPHAQMQLLAPFAKRWKAMDEEISFYRGQPVKMTRRFELGGPDCKGGSGVVMVDDEVWDDASDAAVNAGLSQAGNEAGRAAADGASEAVGDSVAGRVGSRAAGAATNAIFGGLVGAFSSSGSSKESTPDPSEWEMFRVFELNSEITQWSAATLPESTLVLPSAGDS